MVKAVDWNPWHGCHKKSEGCLHCYVYRHDARYEKDASLITKNQSFDLPIKKNRHHEYIYPSGTLFYTCFTSDFLLEDADLWRIEAWNMMRERSDCHFLFLTKRIERLVSVLPADWGDGWSHVSIGCTCENQIRADERLPIFLALPIKHRSMVCEPLLGPIDCAKYLKGGIEQIVVGGESGNEARPCHYEWMISLYHQALEAKVRFYLKQTGANFVKEGKTYHILRRYQREQAQKAFAAIKKI